MSRCPKEAPRLAKRLLEGLDRSEVAVKAVIKVGDRAVTAPVLLQLLAPPAGPLGETFRRTMERAFLGPLLRARWRPRGLASKPAPAEVGAQVTGLIRRPHTS